MSPESLFEDRLRVLIAEDETIIRLDLRQMLEQSGKPFSERDVLPAIHAAVARHQELLDARRNVGRAQAPVDVEVTSTSGNVWPLRLRRRPDGTLDVTLHNVK